MDGEPATADLRISAQILKLIGGIDEFLAIQFEERDLVAEHGDSYERYRRSVPMLIPRVGRQPPFKATR